MPDVQPAVEKTITKTFFGCIKCNKRMESIGIGNGDGGIFGISSSGSKAMYCDNKECERFGMLTVAGIRTEE